MKNPRIEVTKAALHINIQVRHDGDEALQRKQERAVWAELGPGAALDGGVDTIYRVSAKHWDNQVEGKALGRVINNLAQMVPA